MKNCKLSTIDVSIIIPTFNRAESLRRAIDSVLGQTHKNFELIIIDDGSTDRTDALLKDYKDTLTAIKTENKGVSAARNRGIKLARGRYISFLDSDDMWLEKKLERQLKVLKENPSYRIIYTNELWIRNGRRVNQCKIHQKFGGDIYKKCLPLCIISPSSVLINHTVFEDVGLFDESLPVCEDYDLWLRITNKYPVFFLDEDLIIKTGGHQDQLSKRYWGMDRFRVQALLKAFHSGLLPENKNATREEIVKKCEILIAGFKKRGKCKEVNYYFNIIQQIKRED